LSYRNYYDYIYIKSIYIVILKSDEPETHLLKSKWRGVGSQNGHQALYISSHQPTRGRNSVL